MKLRVLITGKNKKICRDISEHPVFREYVSEAEEFYDVTPVKSGDAMFKYLLKHKPDLILLDYMMPEKDGSQKI